MNVEQCQPMDGVFVLPTLLITTRNTPRYTQCAKNGSSSNYKYKLLCPRGTQTCALAVANIAHAVYLLDVAKRPIPQG